MKKSRNRNLGKNKFYNIQKGKKEHGFFFFLPTIMVSPKKFLHWDLIMFSIFLGWGSYFIQFNIFEVVKEGKYYYLVEQNLRFKVENGTVNVFIHLNGKPEDYQNKYAIVKVTDKEGKTSPSVSVLIQ